MSARHGRPCRLVDGDPPTARAASRKRLCMQLRFAHGAYLMPFARPRPTKRKRTVGGFPRFASGDVAVDRHASQRPKVVVIGSGFGGFFAARRYVTDRPLAEVQRRIVAQNRYPVALGKLGSRGTEAAL